MVSSPSGYDPIAHPEAARERRNLVLQRMFEQHFLTRAQYDSCAAASRCPTRATCSRRPRKASHPYFTSWIKQQVVDRLGGGQEGARQAFEGGLKIRTTIDGELQDAAETAIDNWLPNRDGPRAALVAIENKTGMVRAMVGGDADAYNERPFNLATQGQRQPGSAIKPFILAEALRQGISANSVWASKKLTIDVPHSREVFTVNNYENAYSGITTLARATTFSDNSVFAQVGIKVGTRRVARLAERMGIRTNVSHNYAMTLGRPEGGRHAARHGARVRDVRQRRQARSTARSARVPTTGAATRRPARSASSGSSTRRDGKWKPKELPSGERLVNRPRERNVLDRAVAEQVGSLLQGVVRSGTGTHAQVANTVVAGKTGTTEGYGDAWFVGWTPKYTVAVWVGYPNEFKSMKTEYQGQPVAGGTFPAAIFQSFIATDLRNNPPKETGLRRRGAGRSAGRRHDDRPPRPWRRRRDATPAATGRRRPAPTDPPEPRADRAGARRRRSRPTGRPPAGARRRGSERRTPGVTGAARLTTQAPAATAARRCGTPRRRTATAARPPS